MEQIGSLGSQRLVCEAESLADDGRGGAPNLQNHLNGAAAFKQQVDLRAILGPVIVRRSSITSSRNQVLDDKPSQLGPATG